MRFVVVVALGVLAFVTSAPAIAAPRTLLVPVPPGPAVALPLAGPQLLYLNDCKPAGCIVKPGTDDSRTNTTSIVRSQHQLDAYAGDPIIWDAMVTCVRENYAPFGIEVVTTDPGNVPHFEVMVAGLSTQMGFPEGIAGISPFTCEVIPNAITFMFANGVPNDVLSQCWTVSQESAHAFGLEHSMLGTDAMTYAPMPARKRFVDETACIGVTGCCQPSQECRCSRNQINSYQRLLAVLGPRPTPPTISIASPTDGAVVMSGFPISLDVEDSDGIAKVEIVIDGAIAATLTAPPYDFTTSSVAVGKHTIFARAEDTLGAIAETPAIEVTREPDQSVEVTDPPYMPPPGDGGGCCRSSRDGATSSIAALLLALVFATRSRYRASARRRATRGASADPTAT